MQKNRNIARFFHPHIVEANRTSLSYSTLRNIVKTKDLTLKIFNKPTKRKLIIAVGSTLLFLIKSPALAALSTDTSTFSGEVAATCTFDGLGNSYSMTYDSAGNGLKKSVYFDVATNSPDIRIEVSQINTNQEAVGLNGTTVRASASVFQIRGNTTSFSASSTKNNSGRSQPTNISEGNTFRLDTLVWTNERVNNRYQLGPGQYSYSFTISCLL